MKNIKLLATVAAMSAALASLNAQAAMVTDSHGNVGYDTAEECDAAVQAGTAKFYRSFTHHPALLRDGETAVHTATIKDLGPEYRLGACDLGVGRKLGRDGVSKALQGKYVPYSPDMEVNVYTDAAGNRKRVSMKQCDNWFHELRPVAVAPVAVAAPVAACACAPYGLYAFGTLGNLRDGVSTASGNFDDHDNKFAGQIGFGVRFDQWFGAELYYQGAKKHKYVGENGYEWNVRNHTIGTRFTAGLDVAKDTRVFAKLGIAAVRHSAEGYKKTKAQATAGVGATYQLTEHWAVRADYDHYFRRAGDNGVNWKNSDYVGLGIQYSF